MAFYFFYVRAFRLSARKKQVSSFDLNVFSNVLLGYYKVTSDAFSLL